jgi:hypothetical protein
MDDETADIPQTVEALEAVTTVVKRKPGGTFGNKGGRKKD